MRLLRHFVSRNDWVIYLFRFISQQKTISFAVSLRA